MLVQSQIFQTQSFSLLLSFFFIFLQQQKHSKMILKNKMLGTTFAAMTTSTHPGRLSTSDFGVYLWAFLPIQPVSTHFMPKVVDGFEFRTVC